MYTHNRFLTLLFISGLLTACTPSGDTETGNAAADLKQEVASKAEASSVNSDFPYTFEKVASNTWVMHGPLEFPNPENKGFMNNPGVVKTSAGLVLIDPGSTVHVGRHVLNEIKKFSDEDVIAVFNTHIHGDHWLANQAIKEAYPGVKIYGHPKMLKAVADGEGKNWVDLMHSMTEGASDGTTVVAPELTADNTDVIKIGNTRFRIHHFGIAHTKTDIMIEVMEESVIFLGDNVLAERLPRMSDGTFQGNASTISKIMESSVKTYVPGHGPTGDSTIVENYLNYLTLVYDAAKQAFDEDLDSSDVITITRETTAAYKDWSGYDDQIGPHGAQAFAEVEEAEF
jgi:glyoxylase-like metal-dependent hydrolase (beta-lactamase superfamily II)